MKGAGCKMKNYIYSLGIILICFGAAKIIFTVALKRHN